MIDRAQIVEAINLVKAGQDNVDIRPYSAPVDSNANEYCLFLKPEVCRSSKFDVCVDAILNKLNEFGQKPNSCRVLGSKYLVSNSIMEAHYGVIDTVSHAGASAISDEAKASLSRAFDQAILADAEMLGAHQFLERYPSFSADALAVMYDNLSNVRLAGGTHCVMLKVRGKPTVLFNGFHPEQLENYTRSDSAIVVFSFATKLDWKKLRAEMTGATNPLKAPASSIRRMLLERQKELGLDEVSSGRNGIHVSAGPLEGMVELIRFMSGSNAKLVATDTAFGRLLAERNFPPTRVASLMTNPTIQSDGKSVPAFDLTEEINADDAIGKLSQAN